MTFLVFVMAAGLFVVGMGLRTIHKRRKLDRDGVSTMGRVFRLDYDRESHTTTYTPIIAYRDENGLERKFRSSLSSNEIRHPVGSEVPLRYLRGRPEVVELDTGHYRLWSAALPIGVGTVFIVAAVVLLAIGAVRP